MNTNTKKIILFSKHNSFSSIDLLDIYSSIQSVQRASFTVDILTLKIDEKKILALLKLSNYSVLSRNVERCFKDIKQNASALALS